MLHKTRALRAVFLSISLAVGMAFAVPALADDASVVDFHDDTEFNLYLSLSSTTASTSGQQKGETSPVMIYPTRCTVDVCKIRADASVNRDGAWATNSSITVNGYGLIYGSDVASRLLLKTNIHEYGYSYARLTATRISYSGVIGGVWSPDGNSQSGDTIINVGYR